MVGDEGGVPDLAKNRRTDLFSLSFLQTRANSHGRTLVQYDCKMTSQQSVPNIAAAAVLQASEEMPAGSAEVRGYDFDAGVDLAALLESYVTTGFQAAPPSAAAAAPAADTL